MVAPSRAREEGAIAGGGEFFFVNIRWCCSATGSSPIDPRSTDRAAWPRRHRSLRFGAAGIDEPARSTCRDRPCRNRPARSVTGASRLCGALGRRGGSLTSMVWWEWRRCRAVQSRSDDIVDGGECRVGRNVNGGRAPLRSVADTPGFAGRRRATPSDAERH